MVSGAQLIGEEPLHSVDLRGHVSGRYSGDFCDGNRVHVFQIKKDDFTIERGQLLDEEVEPVQRPLTIDRRLGIRNCGQILDLVETDEGSGPGAAVLEDVGRCDVVGYAVDPGAKRTVAGKRAQTLPDSEVNLLK